MDWHLFASELSFRRGGLVRSASEMSPSFAVAEFNRHRGASHAVQINREHCGIVKDSTFFPLETGPCLNAVGEILEMGKELISVVHAERESTFCKAVGLNPLKCPCEAGQTFSSLGQRPKRPRESIAGG